MERRKELRRLMEERRKAAKEVEQNQSEDNQELSTLFPLNATQI